VASAVPGGHNFPEVVPILAAGEPIVNSARDAVSTFLRGKEIDLLVLDDVVVARSEADLPA